MLENGRGEEERRREEKSMETKMDNIEEEKALYKIPIYTPSLPSTLSPHMLYLYST